MQPDFLAGAGLYRDVVAYHGMGDHRTGGEGEAATTAWIAEELSRAGLAVSFQEFALRQFFIGETRLTVAGGEVACFPWWYPKPTGREPVTGRLVDGDSPGENVGGAIVLLRPRAGGPGSRAEAEEKVRELADAGALAVLVVSLGPSGQIAAVNTSETAEPWPVPVMLVGSEDAERLGEAARNGAETAVLLEGEDRPGTTARNVFGRHGGGDDFVIVSTPKSGWFGCGGERGPGVGLALALARWVGHRRPPVSYWFDFNSGHERFNLGTRVFLRDAAPPPEQVRCWLHLGANIATWDFVEAVGAVKPVANPGRYPVVCSDAAFLARVAEGFAPTPEVRPYVGEGIGELGPVIEAGYAGFGIYGGRYRYFHTLVDGPEGTAPELLERVARAVGRTLESIEASASR